MKPGPALSQTNRAEITLRRFWKTVLVQQEATGEYQITLDHRNLKTPAGSRLLVPKQNRLMAMLIAAEWENQDEVLKQHALPLTSLASRALDGLVQEKVRVGVVDGLMHYLETDTILFPEETPAALVRMQHLHWDPLFAWVKDEFGVELSVAQGFSPARQNAETVQQLRQEVERMNNWELAAFERAAYASKSFIIALALCRGRLTAHEAADASHVEVRSQIELWGEVEDSHDVDYHDIRRALGSVSCSLIKA